MRLHCAMKLCHPPYKIQTHHLILNVIEFSIKLKLSEFLKLKPSRAISSLNETYSMLHRTQCSSFVRIWRKYRMKTQIKSVINEINHQNLPKVKENKQYCTIAASKFKPKLFQNYSDTTA